jgi:uncharacterized membrane protein
MTDLLTGILAQQATPRIDAMYWLMLASRFLHIFGAIILLGGIFYLRAVVAPTPAPNDAPDVDPLFGGRRAAWAKWVGIATLLLLVTGLWNYIQIIRTHERLDGLYHMLAGIKMLSALAVFLLAALLAGRSPAAQSLRRRMRLWLNVCLILGIATVALGSVLRSFPRTPKVDAPGPERLVAPANLGAANP